MRKIFNKINPIALLIAILVCLLIINLVSYIFFGIIGLLISIGFIFGVSMCWMIYEFITAPIFDEDFDLEFTEEEITEQLHLK